jgi:hypothetical protein
MKSFKNEMIIELFFSPGIISLINLNICLIKSCEIGRCGINVKIKMSVGGIAMNTLKEIPLALSARLVFFSCLINCGHTSNKEKP